jgi:putative salt-induced outer membrane protein YdiY
MRRWPLAAFFCLLPLLVAAQDPAAQPQAQVAASAVSNPNTDLATGVANDAASVWRGRMTASLSATSGNSRTRLLQLDADVSRRHKGGKTTVTATVNEGQSGVGRDRETTSAKWLGTAQHDRDIDQLHFAFARLSAESDRVIELALRTQVAVGLGRHLIQEDERSLDVFAGLARSTTRYRSPQLIGGDSSQRFSSTGVLLGNEYSEQLSPTVLFKQRLEGYIGLEGNRDRLFKLTSSLQVDVTRRLALTVGLSDTYNSRVAAGQKRNDLALTTGLSVKIGP